MVFFLVLKEFKIPVVAIGGIDLENVKLLVKAGVKCVAIINGLFLAKDIEGTARRFKNILKKNYD